MYRATFTGNSAYCYAHALHMLFSAAFANTPGPGFLECATAMPFGCVFLPSQSTFWPNAPGWDPEKGLDHAIPALGWRCETQFGDDAERAALARLESALQDGPVLVGPVDFGYLSYSPASSHMPGTDHYLVALELRAADICVHDPAGYPFAELPLADFLQAWKAERIGYRRGAYTQRGYFRHARSVSRREVIDQTLELASVLIRQQPTAPNAFGGAEALEQLAQDLRGHVAESLERNLLGFSLPTAARRTTDATSFLAEGERPEAAQIMHEEAVLWGKALSQGARREWQQVANVLVELATRERELVEILSSSTRVAC